MRDRELDVGVTPPGRGRDPHGRASAQPHTPLPLPRENDQADTPPWSVPSFLQGSAARARATLAWFQAEFEPDARLRSFRRLPPHVQTLVVEGLARRYPSPLTDIEIEALRRALAGER